MIDRPIFIIGAGRSGSTVVHDILARHPQVAWLSAIGKRFPLRPAWNGLLLNALDWPVVGSRLAKRFTPWECFDYWERHCTGFRRSCRDLRAEDVSVRTQKIMRHALEQLVTLRRPRLMLKATGWPRIGYLREIFPDAKFVHVMRDGRPVANSLLNVGWWLGWQGPQNWRYGHLSSEFQSEWERHGQSFVALAGIQWKIIMDAVEQGRRHVEPGNFLDVRYETLCEDPVGTIRHLVNFAGLEWTPKFESTVKGERLRSMNDRWREELTGPQQGILQSVLADKLRQWGYG